MNERETEKEKNTKKYYERASTSINFNSIFICFLHAIQFNTINTLHSAVQLSEHGRMMRFLSMREKKVKEEYKVGVIRDEFQD